MTYTRQIRSLATIDKSKSEIDEVNKNLISLHYDLKCLYNKLHKLNSLIIQKNTMKEEK